MKRSKRLFAILLALITVISTNLTALASNTEVSIFTNNSSEESGNVIVTDTGIYINGIYYSQAQFKELLDTAQEVPTRQKRSATIGLVAGTWYIPGVGQVVVTAAGIIIVGGVVIAAGTWTYKAVTKWFAVRAFNKSAENAVNNCNSNKQNHIMNSKHNWNKFNKNPKWNDISPILIKVLKEGTEQWESKNQYIRTLVYKGETVVVRFIKGADGLIEYISTAWCK